MPNTRMKTDPNHKASFLRAVKCCCSCGWESAHWYGIGAQRNAAGEWRSHREKCDAAEVAR